MGGDELKREDRMTTTDFDKIIWRDALTFVDFFATWCGPCQMMHPAIDKFQREMNGRVDVYKVDIDDRGMLDAVHRYNIMSVPTLMVFPPGRSAVARERTRELRPPGKRAAGAGKSANRWHSDELPRENKQCMKGRPMPPDARRAPRGRSLRQGAYPENRLRGVPPAGSLRFAPRRQRAAPPHPGP